MRWVRFDAGDGPRMGQFDGDVVLPVAADRMQDVIAGRGTEPEGSKLRVADVRLLAPVTPSKVLAVGTPSGVGYFREPQLFLSPGDTVEVEIGDFGVLSNPVGEPYRRAATALFTEELAQGGR
jgi:hypothetical protein